MSASALLGQHHHGFMPHACTLSLEALIEENKQPRTARSRLGSLCRIPQTVLLLLGTS